MLSRGNSLAVKVVHVGQAFGPARRCIRFIVSSIFFVRADFFARLRCASAVYIVRALYTFIRRQTAQRGDDTEHFEPVLKMGVVRLDNVGERFIWKLATATATTNTWQRPM